MLSIEKTKQLCFCNYSSVKGLRECANRPFSLCGEGNLTKERIGEMQAENCGFKLFYATEKVDGETFNQLKALADEAQAVEKMLAMQNGEVLNRIEGFSSEERAVLHTATRDFFEDQQQGEMARIAAERAKVESEKLDDFFKKNTLFTDLIMIGIGGSDLGPRAVYQALQAYSDPNKRVHFISNVDPDNAIKVLKQVDLKKTLVAVVSKSGTTLETMTNEEFVRTYYHKQGLASEKHFLAVTGKGSPMDSKERYLESFYIWDYIGGRFSVTSMVGALSIVFSIGYAGYYKFLEGANAMDRSAREKDLKKNLPLLSTLLSIWNQNFLAYQTVAIIPYSEGLSRFSAHVQQCVMESNGKSIDKRGNTVEFLTGPIVWGEPGTNAQHSFFQLIHQGTHIVPVEFIGFIESQYGEDIIFQGTTSQEKLLSNLFAQSLALALGKEDSHPNKAFSGDRPSHVLLGKKLDPYSIGALVSYYEHRAAFQGFIWDINSFDQEGVQLGKVVANEMIRNFDEKRSGDSSKQKGCSLCLEYFKQLEVFS